MNTYALLRPLLFALDPEHAHEMTLDLLETGHRMGLGRQKVAAAPVQAFGLSFPNPVGLAAGLDKNGAHVDALAALGFGFLEVGTVTPRPQPGNPRPRLFRLPEHRAIINRFGFNNDGVDALVHNVGRARFGGVLGINIGKNKTTPNEHAVDDYQYCLERVYAAASYVTVNISSPNTQGLRDLQQGDALKRLLGRLREEQERLGALHGRRPMLLKMAPDVDEAGMDAMAQTLVDLRVDGLICTNTTLDRQIVRDHVHGNEAGGLSGAPLTQRATEVLAGMAQRLEGSVPLVGVGGIMSGRDALAKRQAGASLVQLYSGLVYAGPSLIDDCVRAWRGA
ncbi:quinone-dependent dihydroorotate dehydrogenase [Oleiagrimonas sp. C23AA]|uniref:quinone-dependent dihydroorotate dehydrogenase n=1 Tax=Oleiagrimonas sp. C23AA TaxID=2719047 RepID=UPI00141DD7B5|nr:quinone-dependent dihydroorotate dehydrogenase [Oleiagrimonas sp. C23AA]NII09360.1 quinone-dependent dihydroorotate dehydrogenase [Oleiagrimonas sp. C23AA]